MIGRRREPSASYLAQSRVTLERFAAFVARVNPRAAEVAHVTRALAQAFMDAESKRGVTARTRNDTLSLLRTVFKALLPAGVLNPFLPVLMQETESVFRKAFSPEELAAISEAARTDEFIRPIIVVGMCTAMRRGDCCLLEWKDVDLANRFITVKTSKTGQTVSIPIFPMLEEELKRKADSTPRPAPLPGRGGEGIERAGYVFPEQAAMYLKNPDGITWRVKKVLALALIPREQVKNGVERPMELPMAEAELRRRAAKHIATVVDEAKRQHMKLVLDCYLEGKSLDDVSAITGVSKTSVSNYLRELEAGVAGRIVRGRPDGRSAAALLKKSPGLLLAKREHGVRRASVRDFHSFRVTWVTLALTALKSKRGKKMKMIRLERTVAAPLAIVPPETEPSWFLAGRLGSGAKTGCRPGSAISDSICAWWRRSRILSRHCTRKWISFC